MSDAAINSAAAVENRVNVTFEDGEFKALAAEVLSLLKFDIDVNDLPRELRQKLIGFVQTPAQLFHIDAEGSFTGGASQCRVRFEPSDSFRNLVLALRAWKREHDATIKHGAIPPCNSDAEWYHKHGPVNSN